ERLARFRIIGFIDASRIRFCELSKNFEAADFRRHCFLPSPGEALANAPRKEHTGSDSGVGNHKDSLGRKRLRVTKVLGKWGHKTSPQRHRDTEKTFWLLRFFLRLRNCVVRHQRVGSPDFT